MASHREAAERIPATPGLEPEHIVATSSWKSRAVLVDQWGRTFPLRRSTLIGRSVDEVDIAVLDDAVSLVHAEIYWRDGQWMVRDQNSTNGTFVEGRRICGLARLRHGQVLVLGDVGFMFALL